MKTNTKQFAALAALLTVSLATLIAPASADKPTELQDHVVFPDVDPCTGDIHEVNIFFDVFLHEGHKKNVVVHTKTTGFTDSGYEMFAGSTHIVENDHVFIRGNKDLWRNDDGQMFEAASTFVLNLEQGEVKVDNFGLRCIGGDTFL